MRLLSRLSSTLRNSLPYAIRLFIALTLRESAMRSFSRASEKMKLANFFDPRPSPSTHNPNADDPGVENDAGQSTLPRGHNGQNRTH